MTTDRSWPDVAIPPGETLAEELEAREMTQTELARQMGRPVQAINEIVRGKKEITAQTALQLEEVLGTPAHVWLGLESDYRLVRARIELQTLRAASSTPTRPHRLAATAGPRARRGR